MARRALLTSLWRNTHHTAIGKLPRPRGTTINVWPRKMELADQDVDVNFNCLISHLRSEEEQMARTYCKYLPFILTGAKINAFLGLGNT